MTPLATLNAERIKLSTTRSPVWISAAVAVLSLMLAALQGGLADGRAPLAPERAAIGIAVFGVPVLMVLASMSVTAEYRSAMIRTTFIAAPNRTLVLTAKAFVTAVLSAIIAAVTMIAAGVVYRLFATGRTGADLSLFWPDTGRYAGAIALYAALAAVLGVAVGALLRAGPGAVAALLLWPLVAEPMLGNLPDVGPTVGPYLPFGNIFIFIDVPWLYPVYVMPWGAFGSLMYFAGGALVLFGVAIGVVNVRDA